jgi:hypothetical protein
MVVRYAQRLLIEVAVVCSGSSLAAQCFAPDPALDTAEQRAVVLAIKDN